MVISLVLDKCRRRGVVEVSWKLGGGSFSGTDRRDAMWQCGGWLLPCTVPPQDLSACNVSGLCIRTLRVM